MIEHTSFNWDDDTDMWEVSSQYKYSYTADGSLASLIRLYKNYSTSFLENNWKEDYSYNAGGELVTVLNSDWNSGLYTWEDDDKETYIYESELLARIIMENWDNGSSQWENSYKEEYSYNTNERVASLVEYDWRWDSDLSDYVWLMDDKDEFSYAADGSLSEVVSFDYNQDSTRWEKSWKTVYEYDPSVGLESLKIPYEFNEFFLEDGMLLSLSSFDWDEDTETWENDYMVTLSYSPYVGVGIDNELEKDEAIRLYPVPVRDLLHVDIPSEMLTSGASISLYNLQGALVMKAEITSDHTVLDVSEISRGAYIIRLQAGSQKLNRSFIKL